jgi:hypothetical protein
VEKIGIGTEQADFVLGTAAAHTVAILQIKAGLAVKAQVGYFFIAAQQNFYHR